MGKFVKVTKEVLKAAEIILEDGLSISNDQSDVISDRDGYQISYSFGDTKHYGDNLEKAMNELLKRDQQYC